MVFIHSKTISIKLFYIFKIKCSAVAHANKAKRKTLAVNDILAALNDMEFDSFVPPLNESLKCKI